MESVPNCLPFLNGSNTPSTLYHPRQLDVIQSGCLHAGGTSNVCYILMRIVSMFSSTSVSLIMSSAATEHALKIFLYQG